MRNQDKIYAERFRKIIDFLKELDEERFDYGIVADKVVEGHCGTKGCVLGWFPDIFPGEFILGGAPINIMYPTNLQDTMIEPHHFLGITEDEYEMLFEPLSLESFIDDDGYGDEFDRYEEFKYLNKYSSAKEVAELFEAFYQNNF